MAAGTAAAPPVTALDRMVPILGIFVFMAIAVLFSRDRKRALGNHRIVLWGLALQFILAVVVLKTPFGRHFFNAMNNFFVAIVDCTQVGSSFVFGNLAKPGGEGSLGFFFAFYVLPTIIFFSSFTAILYHIGLMQKIVSGLAWIMQKTMRTSGAETLSASANIFLGQTEAPLVVRPFIPRMTESEIFSIMTTGYASIAGGVLAAYVGFLQESVPDIAGHLLSASLMSAPAGMLFAKLIAPEDGEPVTAGIHVHETPMQYTSALDAAAEGASEGLKLAFNVAAMLIAFLALIALADMGLAWLGGVYGWAFGGAEGLTPNAAWNLRTILGFVMRPFAWLMGIPWAECGEAGQILGVKTIANEFIAYVDLGAAKERLSERTSIILSYALCGFANLGSIGIQIGGLSVLAPERRPALVRAAFPAMVAGSLATFSMACFAAILI